MKLVHPGQAGADDEDVVARRRADGSRHRFGRVIRDETIAGLWYHWTLRPHHNPRASTVGPIPRDPSGASAGSADADLIGSLTANCDLLPVDGEGARA